LSYPPNHLFRGNPSSAPAFLSGNPCNQTPVDRKEAFPSLNGVTVARNLLKLALLSCTWASRTHCIIGSINCAFPKQS
jgi:hypothetical protein